MSTNKGGGSGPGHTGEVVDFLNKRDMRKPDEPPSDRAEPQGASGNSEPGTSRSEENEGSCRVPEKTPPANPELDEFRRRYMQCFFDCEKLPPTALRQKYRSEEATHRNMLSRAKKQGRVVSDSFRKFADFLRHVGPKPTPGATLDRTDNGDPEYGPGKVRWADRRTQNNNKGDTILLHHPVTLETVTISQVAARHGLKPDTVRKRRRDGWSDREIIENRRRTRSDGAAAHPVAGHRAQDEFAGLRTRRDFLEFRPWPCRPGLVPPDVWERRYRWHRRHGEDRWDFMLRSLRNRVAYLEGRLEFLKVPEEWIPADWSPPDDAEVEEMMAELQTFRALLKETLRRRQSYRRAAAEMAARERGEEPEDIT